jgi:hypothetical protein
MVKDVERTGRRSWRQRDLSDVASNSVSGRKILIVARTRSAEFGASPTPPPSASLRQQMPGATIDVAVFGSDARPWPPRPRSSTAWHACCASTARPMRMRWPRCSRRRSPRCAAGYSHVFGPPPPSARTCCRAWRRCSMRPGLSDIMAVEGATRFRRPIYAGNAIVTVEGAGAQVLVARCAPPRSPPPPGWRRPASKPRLDVALPTHTRFVGSRPRQRSPRPAERRARRLRWPRRWAAPTTSGSSTRSPTSSAQPWAPRAPRSMPATCPTTCRSARPARSSPPSSTSPSASAARSST